MVTSVDSVRLWSTQTALRIFKENDAQAASSDAGDSSLASRLLSDYGLGNSDDDSGNPTYSLADLLAGNSGGAAPSTDTAAPVSDDVGSVSFMTGLKAKLTELAASPSTKAQAEAMLKALSDGTLIVTDVTKGAQIAAWDVDDPKAKATGATSTAVSEWSGFLRDSLVRQSGGTYQLNADRSHTDKATGQSAYFGMIGDSYAYLTWPTAGAK